MTHMEFDPPKPSPMLPVPLQLHKETYEHLKVWKPTAYPPNESQVCQVTAPLEIHTQAFAHTGAQTDILNIATLKSLGFHPDTLIKLQIRVTSAVIGSQIDIRGGIFLSVHSSDNNNQRKTIHLFYVAGNVSQNLLSWSCLQALLMIDKDFPRIGTATSKTPQPVIPATKAQERGTQGHCSGTLLRNTALGDNTAYASR